MILEVRDRVSSISYLKRHLRTLSIVIKGRESSGVGCGKEVQRVKGKTTHGRPREVNRRKVSNNEIHE